MPSPAIPHSKSAPDITSPQNILSSSKSVVTSRSAGSPLTSWSKKLGGFITGKNKNSDFTEERLWEFNRRNALLEARYSSSSPYYKGLTDNSLVINREKHSGSSPGRESRATSFASASTKSSFVVKVQEWGGSCFTSRKNENPPPSSSSFASWTKSSRDNRLVLSSSSSTSRVTETVVFISPTVKKPLRERDSGLSPMLPLSPPIASPPASLPYPLPQITPPESLPYPPLPQITRPTAQESLSPPPTPPLDTPPPQTVQAQQPHTPGSGGATDENREGLTHTGETERKYIWADNYRPFWLREFLCNREKALWLQEIVRSWQDTQEECGHFIFEGNPGVGKRTMIWALLREAFGPEKVEGEAVSSITVNLMVSPQHVEVNLSELKGYEKHVIVELIKEKSPIMSGTTLNCNQENIYQDDAASVCSCRRGRSIAIMLDIGRRWSSGVDGAPS